MTDLVILNRVCRAGFLPPLRTIEEAEKYYYRPKGSIDYCFYPQLPDLGANDAAAFSRSLQCQWLLAVLVTLGPEALERAHIAQDKAFAQFAAILPAIHEATQRIAALIDFED